MKLRQINTEVAIFELREQVGVVLGESISDYFAMALAQIKNGKTPDLDQLAELIAGLKVLSHADHRESMTRDDIGINPNNMKELFNVLNGVTKDGKNMPKLTADMFAALKSIAPSMYRKTREELEVLEKGEKAAKEQLTRKVEAFATKVNQLFYKLKHGATQPPAKQQTPDVDKAYDGVDDARI